MVCLETLNFCLETPLFKTRDSTEKDFRKDCYNNHGIIVS